MNAIRERRLTWNDPQWIRAEIDRLGAEDRPLTDSERSWLQTLTDREEDLGRE
ncbi:MAG: hypothetical protein ACHQNA_11355 [Acidimicrobiales bacterium]